MPLGLACDPMLNLPPHPGTTGLLLLVLGPVAAGLFFVIGHRRFRAELGASNDFFLVWSVTITLGVTLAAAPYTLWRVLYDIRESAAFTADHARYVGAETKLIDGLLVEQVAALIPERADYFVAVAPDGFSEIRESLGQWMGYALIPRRRTLSPREAEWIVTWGATPAQLGLRAGTPQLVGRNRLFEDEPVYLARRVS